MSSSKSLGQALESLAQKVQCGVVLNFEKIGGASNPPPPPHEGELHGNIKIKMAQSFVFNFVNPFSPKSHLSLSGVRQKNL